ncbi:MAG: phage Gp37/Gp68 family protein [Nostoc sp. NMS7]|uniref:DUF5131 family protein n=1 Tax=Nostoc sp. NMS7 TaxID=2815391 RepID=UPI0025ED8C32|nr:phage Gp37/Gp68 family protein [Nostoc sp. NMS7]MBN3948389.1 phage Gp37/Gp68 family protein [Nostoc sp. NMS7]
MSTSISWTDETWNAITGCSRISAGCANCYAATAAASPRLQQFPQYQKVADWDGTVEFVESQLLKPLSWKKPKRIFVCSMSDLFHENVPDEWRERIFAVMSLCQQHTFQVLTKRPDRALEYFNQQSLWAKWYEAASCHLWSAIGEKFGGLINLQQHFNKQSFPLPNVWIGTSCENQAMADKRIPVLLQISAAVRFLSCEPLLDEVNLSHWVGCNCPADCFGQDPHNIYCPKSTNFVGNHLSWAIVGGESGKGARECHIDWVRSLVQQCFIGDVPVFVKQLGSNPLGSSPYIDGVACVNYFVKLRDKKGGDISEFPEDLQVREFPDV